MAYTLSEPSTITSRYEVWLATQSDGERGLFSLRAMPACSTRTVKYSIVQCRCSTSDA